MRTAIALVLVLAASLSGQPVSRDTSVPQTPLSAIDTTNPVALWHALDAFPFWAIPVAPPATYYDSADTSSPPALRTSLHEIIKDHRVFRYYEPSRPGQSNHKVDTWDIIAIADAHPTQAGKILDLYGNMTLGRQLVGPQTNPRYDREHSWPKSYGFDDSSTDNPAYSDCHHLVAAFNTYNNHRSNKPFGDLAADPAIERPTHLNSGRGAAASSQSSNYNGDSLWQVWLGRRGDIARGLFYMDLRYEGGENEADLILTDESAKIKSNTDAWENSGRAFMGLRSALLKWHREDPVDDLERRRHAVVFLFQGNRNPFIDHPEWVGFLFNGEPLTPPAPDPATLAAAPATFWISEFHYDNQGDDAGEFVEVSGPSGAHLIGWTLALYNGGDGRVYKTIQLSGAIPFESGGLGALAFDTPGIQNGAPDAIALVNPAGQVIDFIAYEGTLTASQGPAAGLTAPDCGVAQQPSTPAGQSLQRRGLTSLWEGPAQSTRGRLN